MAQLCTTIAKQPCCSTPSLPVLPSRTPLRSSVLTSRLQARTRRSCSRSAGSKAVAQLVSSSPAQLVRQPKQPIVLSRNQLANKQVVTRTDGQILGIVDHLLADPYTFKVDALSCKPSPDLLAGDVPRQIGLMSLKQISDVLLVHDSRALLNPAEVRTVGMGYVKLVGTVVKTYEGKVIGKVRDFLFSPDDGRITELVVDALGIPALPERLLGCLGVRIQLVSNITFNCISLQPGAEAYVDKISPGAFDGAVELLKGYLPFIGSGSPEVEESRDDPAYVEWYLNHGQAYEQLNGKKIARPSALALQSALEARGMQQPQALPPGRQPSYESQLQPQAQPQAQYQSQLQYQEAEPQLAGNYTQQAQQSSAAFQSQPSPYAQQSQPLPDDWLQQQQPPQQQQQQRPPSCLQAQPQLQQPQTSQQAASSGQAGKQPPMYAVTPNKVEQQRRYAARADTTITEPRFDPRRRKSGMLSPEQTPAASSNLGVSQPRASAASAASRLSYTPDRSNGVQSSQSSGSSQGAQPKGPLSQGTSGQPSAELAAWQSEGRRGTEQSGNSEAFQGRSAQPPQRSFDSWADVSLSPVQPVVVMPNGTLDTA